MGFRSTLREVVAFISYQYLGGSALAEHRVEQIQEHSRISLSLRFLRGQASAVWFYSLLSVEMAYRYLRAYRYRRKGITVFVDRYIYDLVTGAMHGYSEKFPRVRALLQWLYFRPTKSYLLQVDAATVLSRKNDLDAQTLNVFLDLYGDLARKRGFKMLDGRRSPTANADTVIADNFKTIVEMART